MIERYRAGLVVANVVWIAGLVASTGGLERPYWALMAAPLLIAAVSMSRAAELPDRLCRDASRPRSRWSPPDPSPTTTGARWSWSCRWARASPGSSGCCAPPSGTSAGRPARSATSCAAGSTSCRRCWPRPPRATSPSGSRRAETANESVRALTESFNNTLLNLRQLVEQIRSGGDQITASAGELLATAEEHAASATQQSSAVAETTSTIEELAATAAQIADTAESVARYAAETLRHAEDGRTAVATSVARDGRHRRPGRLDRHPGPVAGREGPGDRPDPRGHRRPRRPDQPARPQRRHRGGPGRRARPRLRGRRLRGAQAGRALAGVGRADPGDRHPDPGRDQRHHPRQRGGRQGGPQRRRAGPRGRRRAGADLRHGRRDHHGGQGDLDRHPAAAVGLRPGGVRDDPGLRRVPAVRRRVQAGRGRRCPAERRSPPSCGRRSSSSGSA